MPVPDHGWMKAVPCSASSVWKSLPRPPLSLSAMIVSGTIPIMITKNCMTSL